MESESIGVDVHKACFDACAIGPTGERRWDTRFDLTSDGIRRFLARCDPAAALAVDATGPTWASSMPWPRGSRRA